ncbi:UNVERIFIED_CONTAM: hypothetical protein Sindi_0081400 [Sesamum indicum]
MEALHLGFLQRIEQDMQFTYHWKCESSKVFQLGFADDLLLFCRADLESIRVFKEGLDWFAELSGLRLNVHKSHLIISRSAQELKDMMLEILGFQEGHLPMRWEGISLSYAGRVQIIKSVLSALSLYWASAFMLPKKVINEIEKRLRTFFWKGTTSNGYAKVAWKDVCRPKDEGGLGFKDISTLNRALMSKKLCDVIRCDRTSIWVQWLYQDRLHDTSIWTVREHGGFWGWRKMLRLHPFLRSIVNYQIGNGGRFYIWQDPWHHLGPLIEQFPRGPNHLGIEKSAKINSMISAGEWHWPPITDFECLEITHNLPCIIGREDRVVWRFDGGQPTTQALYRLFDPPEPKVEWSLLLSGSLKIPRHSFILWLAILGKLSSTDKPWLSHLGACILCEEGATESHSHLFFQCRYSRQCLLEIRRRIRFHWPNRDWAMDIEWATRKWRVVEYRIGDGSEFFLWKDPWHHLRPLLDRFPRGPNSLGLHESTMLSSVICEGHWHWPLITDMDCVEITHVLPRIHGGIDRIIWKGSSGKPTIQEFYRAMIPAGSKVGWISLLSDLVEDASVVFGALYDSSGLIGIGSEMLNGMQENGVGSTSSIYPTDACLDRVYTIFGGRGT